MAGPFSDITSSLGSALARQADQHMVDGQSALRAQHQQFQPGSIIPMGSQQAQLAPITNDIWATSSTSTFNHYGQVKYFRKNFKEYSKEDFRNISKEPVVKEIMSGMSKIGMEEAERRIAEYLKD